MSAPSHSAEWSGAMGISPESLRLRRIPVLSLGCRGVNLPKKNTHVKKIRRIQRITNHVDFKAVKERNLGK